MDGGQSAAIPRESVSERGKGGGGGGSLCLNTDEGETRRGLR